MSASDLASWLISSGVIVTREVYLRRWENIERMAEHETEPELYHEADGGDDGNGGS